MVMYDACVVVYDAILMQDGLASWSEVHGVCVHVGMTMTYSPWRLCEQCNSIYAHDVLHAVWLFSHSYAG